jgi:hypothetical protein
MATFTIPSILLAVGTRTFGPFTVGNNTRAEIDVDRTVANGLNARTSASLLDVKIQTSPDGVVWNDEIETVWTGGIFTDKHGGQVNTDVMTVQGIPTTATQVRIVTVVSGPASIRIAGTVTVT